MSYKVTAWVLEHSDATLAARLVLLALAEVAHDDGGMSFQSVATVARKSRIGESTARGCLRKLEADGRIAQQGKTRSGTIIYRVCMADAPELGPPSESGPPQNRALGGPDSSSRGPGSGPEPSGTTQEPPVRETRERASVRISGKPVNTAAWERAVAVLEIFNEATGKKLAALTGGGEPSESAKRIYRPVKDHPHLTLDDFRRIIANTLASGWWDGGVGADPQVGVVFGPKVFEENVHRPATKAVSRPGSAKAAARQQRTAERQARFEAEKGNV